MEKVLNVITAQIINPVIGLMMAIAFIYFLWGVVQFISADDKSRDAGKRHIVWGIIGLFIMISAFGIVNVIVTTIKQIS